MNAPQPAEVRTRDELESLIRAIKQATMAGTLEQVRPDSAPFASDMDIASLQETGPWPDYIEMRFRLTGTTTVLKLSVETYHGVGGKWGPE